MPFRVIAKEIPNVLPHPDALLGVVKMQMPEQGGETDGRVREDERERNLRIVQTAVASFGTWAQRVGAPAVFLFPEFSVSEAAADWLREEMTTSRIAPNTLLVLGLEQITTDQFRARVAASNSRDDFAQLEFGPNIDLVNTAMILSKDNAGEVSCLYQPKCTLSDYESTRQFTSQTVYQITFGPYRLIVSICSDFLLRDDGGTVVGSVMQDIETLYQTPGDHRIDLILLIQKNPAPFHPFYHQSIRSLFYNRPHRIQTTDTIVCAVNSANPATPSKFGRSNVSVMRRGRPPREYAKRPALEHFAWCSLQADGDHQNEDLHYVRWRLRDPGAISFILDTDRRPWPPGSVHSLPVRQVGLHRIGVGEHFQEVRPLPEVYEVQEALYGQFGNFIDTTFQTDVLRLHFREIASYEVLLERIFVHRPHAILRQLLRLHNVNANCDHWPFGRLEGAFRSFLLSLRLLAECYPDLRIEHEHLHGDGRLIGVVDCAQRAFAEIIDQLRDPAAFEPRIQVAFFQRISALYPWDGTPARLETLIGIISVTKPRPTPSIVGSITRAPSPLFVDTGALINMLNQRGATAATIRETLHGNLRFT